MSMVSFHRSSSSIRSSTRPSWRSQKRTEASYLVRIASTSSGPSVTSAYGGQSGWVAQSGSKWEVGEVNGSCGSNVSICRNQLSYRPLRLRKSMPSSNVLLIGKSSSLCRRSRLCMFCQPPWRRISRSVPVAPSGLSWLGANSVGVGARSATQLSLSWPR